MGRTYTIPKYQLQRMSVHSTHLLISIQEPRNFPKIHHLGNAIRATMNVAQLDYLEARDTAMDGRRGDTLARLHVPSIVTTRGALAAQTAPAGKARRNKRKANNNTDEEPLPQAQIDAQVDSILRDFAPYLSGVEFSADVCNEVDSLVQREVEEVRGGVEVHPEVERQHSWKTAEEVMVSGRRGVQSHGSLLLEAVATGGDGVAPMEAVDKARLKVPRPSKASEDGRSSGWKEAAENARSQVVHLGRRADNLELLDAFGPPLWRKAAEQAQTLGKVVEAAETIKRRDEDVERRRRRVKAARFAP